MLRRKEGCDLTWPGIGKEIACHTKIAIDGRAIHQQSESCGLQLLGLLSNARFESENDFVLHLLVDSTEYNKYLIRRRLNASNWSW
jgi:hypothetical protein